MSRLATLLRGGGSIAVAIGVMNVATYGFTVLSARFLGPGSYGALASLMATLLVLGVVQLGLQATAARRISAHPEHVAQIEQIIMRVTYRASWALGAVLLLVSPLVNVLLRLDSLPTAVLVAVTIVPMTVMGGQAGILQGERRWWALSALYLAAGVPRFAIGLALVSWRPTELNALLGVTLGALAPVAVGWWALRGTRVEVALSQTHRARALVRESVQNSQALLAFFLLSNIDVIVARNVLDSDQAGLYAGGLILTKAVLFLPQFIVIVAFPAMSTLQERRRAMTRSMAVILGLGIAATAGVTVLSGLALVFVGGAEYADVQSRLWLFAVLGMVLSMLQLLVYAVLARQGQRSVYAVWAALVVLAGLGALTRSLVGLFTVVIVVDVVLLGVLMAITFLGANNRHDPAPKPVDPVDAVR